jgi:multidrug efflux pump subunit AcrA (membrane-fusion protein)
MSNIFRKSSLDKISSPDQLDQVIVITPPIFWLSMAGLAVILLTALIWSIFGRIPVNVSAGGICMTGSGIRVLYAPKAGIIETVMVEDGDRISKGDVIAAFSGKEPKKKLEQLSARRESVEAVTIDSLYDTPGADNKDLLELKSQLITLKSSLNANEEMLLARQRQLADQQKKTNNALNEMQLARNMYFAFMKTSTDTLESIRFQDAQNALRNAESYYESAKIGLDGFRSENDEMIDYYEDEIDKLKDRQAALNPGDPSYQSEYASLQDKIDGYRAERESLKDQRHEYEDSLEERENRLKNAQNEYYNTAFAYIEAENAELHRQVFDNQLQDDYNLKLNNYNTELSSLRSLENTVIELTVQTSAEEAGVVDKYEALKARFDAAKASVLEGLDREKTELELELDKTEIKSDADGYILGLNIAKGNAVAEGSAICRIAKNNVFALSAGAADEEGIDDISDTSAEANADTDEAMTALLYVDVDNGRKIIEGMDVKLYPSTVNKHEYGHINAKVSRVEEYVTTAEEMKNALGDDSLVKSYAEKGPVVQVVCSLNPDLSTKSGYEWSSKKGASVELKPGTPVTADIVTEKKAPITMLIPFLKEKLTVKVKTEQDGEQK